MLWGADGRVGLPARRHWRRCGGGRGKGERVCVSETRGDERVSETRG